MKEKGFLVLESGEIFPGVWHGGVDRVGEVVFNTAHSGYEETATDPSYFRQIMVCTAPQQGNYSVDSSVWESRKIWIEGFVCLEIQDSDRDADWKSLLIKNDIPVLTDLDTRKIALILRSKGTPVGALVKAATEEEARRKFAHLRGQFDRQDLDWVHAVSRTSVEDHLGDVPQGPRVAVLDYGVKQNSLREIQRRAKAYRIFPSRASAHEILDWSPDVVFLSNGPGDPAHVQKAVETVRELLGKKRIFGICMGHQILAMALGAKTFRLKFGHRGVNHPIEDRLQNCVYMTSQNHGYAVIPESIPSDVQVSHVNLNDLSVAGIYHPRTKAFSVQFHPESHPGPHEASELFDFILGKLDIKWDRSTIEQRGEGVRR